MKRALNILLICGLLFIAASPSHAQTIIRDTEIENTFRAWMAPLLKSAGMGEDSVNLILVQSPQVNAFVAGGANIFIYTGLIEKSENPGEIIGVLAHELGHIAGGHLIAGRDAMERASYESILGTVLGVGAAIVAGRGDVASAVITGSNSMAQRRFLAHSRVNESSADQAALRFFESAGLNPNGLKTFLQKLESEELLPADRQTEYVRTHPVTRDRVAALQTRIDASPSANTPLPEKWSEEHARMKAKLMGFIDPGRVVWTYNDSDTSVPARYARAIAAYKENRVADALEAIDGLIAAEPENPYFKELKGQILLGAGRIEEAIPEYRAAVAAAPHAALIRIDLARSLLESRQQAKNTEEAIENLQRALVDEPRTGLVHRLLATAYGRGGNEGMAKLHLAEEAVLQRRLPYAKTLAETAKSAFPANSREWLKAQDILGHIENLEGQEE